MTHEIPHLVLRQIADALVLEPEWIHSDTAGLGFVAAELGCWCEIRQHDAAEAVHCEVRVARNVAAGPRAASFVDARNQYALGGRWILDAASGVVAITGDIVLGLGGTALDVAAAAEMVSVLVNTAETAAFLGAAQRDLHGAKALTLIRGHRRETAHSLVEHLPRNVYPAGAGDEAARIALYLLQDVLVVELLDLGWEHDETESRGVRRDGASVVIRVARHPHAGYGLMISLGGDLFECGSEAEAADAAAELNLQATEAGEGLACWTTAGSHVEYRQFLPNSLLTIINDNLPVPSLLLAAARDVARGGPLERDGWPTRQESSMSRSGWPDDDAALAMARREPINDGIQTVEREPPLPDHFVWVDSLGRAAATGPTSFQLWLSRLTEEDRADDGIQGFIRWWQGEYQHRQVLDL